MPAFNPRVNPFPEPPRAFRSGTFNEYDLGYCEHCDSFEWNRDLTEVSVEAVLGGAHIEYWCPECVSNDGFTCYLCDNVVSGTSHEVQTNGYTVVVCDDCAIGNATECMGCSGVFMTDEMRYSRYEGGYLCASCHEEYGTCDECGYETRLEFLTYCESREEHLCSDCFDDECDDNKPKNNCEAVLKVNGKPVERFLNFTIGIEYEGEWVAQETPKPNDYHSRVSAPEPIPGDWSLERDVSIKRTEPDNTVAELISPPVVNPNYIIAVVDWFNKKFRRVENDTAGLHINVGGFSSREEAIEFAYKAVSIEELFFQIVDGGFKRMAINANGYAKKIRYNFNEYDESTLTNVKYNSVRVRPNQVVEIRAPASPTKTIDLVMAIALTNALYNSEHPKLVFGCEKAAAWQIKWLIEEVGWRKGGEWVGFWYDLHDPPMIDLEIYDEDGHVVATNYTRLPDEEQIVNALASNLMQLIIKAGSEFWAEKELDLYFYYKLIGKRYEKLERYFAEQVNKILRDKDIYLTPRKIARAATAAVSIVLAGWRQS